MNFPVSVKGIVVQRGRLVLLRNERDEWELPGGRLEDGESPEECVVREISEELGLDVAVDRIVDSWVYSPVPGRQVLIVTYLCECLDMRAPVLSHEHKELGFFEKSALNTLNIPAGYVHSIDTALNLGH